MDTIITISDLTKMAVVVVGVWGFYKIIMEIVKAITDRHDKEQKWDEVAESMQSNIQAERDKIYNRYDSQLSDMRKELENNYTDTEAKLQEIKAEQFILTECMQGVLDGLHQLKCNGKVTEASERLDNYLNKRAHEW